jgi:hypothetical protein
MAPSGMVFRFYLRNGEAAAFSRFFPARSIFAGKQKGGRGAVGFGDDPQLVARRGAVAAEKTETLSQAEIILGFVFQGKLAPIAGHVAREEFHHILSGLFERCQSARCGDEAAQVKQGFVRDSLHDLISPFRDLAFAPQRRGAEPRTRKQMPFMAGERACPPALSRPRGGRSSQRSGEP